MKPYLLQNEIDNNFKFFKYETNKGIDFEVYIDDYGQSFTLAWIDPITNAISQWCCGAYNDYRWDMEDIAIYVNKRKEKINGTSI